MNRFFGIGLLFAACAWAQLDLSSLDKLAAKAKSVDQVNLDGSQLKGMADMVPKDEKDKDGVKKIASNLNAIQVRDYTFAQPGQYSDSDLDAVRKQVAGLPGCNKIIESKEDKEHSEIYSCGGPNGSGMIIMDAEPKEVSVVFIRGPFKLSDLSKLQGMMGTPKIGEKDKEKDKDKDK